MMKLSVVTTFNRAGMIEYGQSMINSFIKNWPSEITLYVYAEDCEPQISSDNVIVIPATTLTDLTDFKNKWKNDPKANGVCPWPERRPRDWQKGFKWDAVRFSNKVYAIFECARVSDADILLWMDGDTICHSPMSMQSIVELIPYEYDICYLGRENKWPECGLYSLNLKSEKTQLFLDKFRQQYVDAEHGIFLLDEWHDSFVFDHVMKLSNPKTLNWSAGIIKGEGHPLINSRWGAYLDHLKGNRKKIGKSNLADLVISRDEEYWKKQ